MADYDDEEEEIIRKHRAAKAKKREEDDNREVRIWHRSDDGKEYETGLPLGKAKGYLRNFPGLNLDDEPVQGEGKDDDAKDQGDGKGDGKGDGTVKRFTSGRRIS